MNIALKPEAADSSLDLKNVGELAYYKNGVKGFVKVEKVLNLQTQSYIDYPAKYSTEDVLRLIGASSLEKLIQQTIQGRLQFNSMEISKTNIDGVLIIEPKVFKDPRGYFFESFSQREFDEKITPILGHTINFVQDNESMSSYGVMRGLHFQRPQARHPQRLRYPLQHRYEPLSGVNLI